MGTKTERIERKRIVLSTLTPPMNIERDPIVASEEFMAIHDGEGIWVRVVDFTQVDINFGDVVMGLQEDQAMRLPDVYTFLVGTDELVAFAAQAAQQELYGRLKTEAFTSLDQALAAAEEIVD